MVIVSGMSAWEYYQTPPMLRDVEIPEDVAYREDGAGFPLWLKRVRSNAGEQARAIQTRLRFDLKNLSLPIEIAVPSQGFAMRATRLLRPKYCDGGVFRDQVHALGGNVGVASVPFMLSQLARTLSFERLLCVLYESCGIYCVLHESPAVSYMLNVWQSQGIIHRHMFDRAPKVYAYCNLAGEPTCFADCDGNEPAWTLCFDRFGKPTDLWKRSPLTSKEELGEFVEAYPHLPGVPTLRKALRYVANGSGSPLETKLAILLCLDAWRGGLGWQLPLLNCRIDFTKEARALSHQAYAVGDLVWPDRMVDIEVDGEAFHADERGFKVVSGRTAALRSMGYHVESITYEQMSNEEQLEAMVKIFSECLKLPPKLRTSAFLEKRRHLLSALFDDV